MRVTHIYDNYDRRVNVFTDLKIGDKFKPVKTTIGKGDIGASGLIYDYIEFKEGQIYEVYRVSKWGWVDVGWVVDEDGVSHWASPDILEPV